MYDVADTTKATTLSHLRVRFCDTDLMGVVHHANYLAYFEAGRVEWLRRRGVTYGDWTSRGIYLAVVEAAVQYRAPARFDDVLDIETRLTQLKSVSTRFAYHLRRDGVLLAEGFTRLACIDTSHKLKRLPAELIDVLSSPELAPAIPALVDSRP